MLSFMTSGQEPTTIRRLEVPRVTSGSSIVARSQSLNTIEVLHYFSQPEGWQLQEEAVNGKDQGLAMNCSVHWNQLDEKVAE